MRSLFIWMGLFCLMQAGAHAASPPPEALAVGYDYHSFSSQFTLETVDIRRTKKSGFSWYVWDLFGAKADPRAIQINSDGSVTLAGDKTKANGQLVTAVKASPFVGVAFGGGAYIEATLRFDLDAVSRATVQAWPAFWSLPFEGNVVSGLDGWVGQARDYRHSMEVDFFEAIRNPEGLSGPAYGASIHEWYGVYRKTCLDGLCGSSMPYHEGMRLVPHDTDFSYYHRYGFLWVPAKPDRRGYVKFYFDRKQVGPTRYWTLYEDQPPPPQGQPWAFGYLDQQHIFLILSSGLGQPMTVKSVDVWQKDNQSNLMR